MPDDKVRVALEARKARNEFNAQVDRGEMTVAEALRQMRTMMSMTQGEFGHRFKLSQRQVSELENDRANPTAQTLNRLGKVFGLQVGFIRVKKP